MTEDEIKGLFTLSDTDGCPEIPYFDIVDDDGNELAVDSDLGTMLELEGRDYKSLKFNTDLPV